MDPKVTTVNHTMSLVVLSRIFVCKSNEVVYFYPLGAKATKYVHSMKQTQLKEGGQMAPEVEYILQNELNFG